MGEKAAELLIKQLENGNNSSKSESSIEIDPKLVVRKSTVKNAPDDWILVDW
jgi:DNA-binding LacI/PurR family transcriptional regulator